MRRFADSGDAALYLWDYFFLAERPKPGEEKPWRLIENAAGRIRESEPYLIAKYPAAVRVRNAKRILRAVRVMLKQIDRLESVPALWTAEVLAYFEVLAESVIESLADDAKEAALH